MTTLDQSIITLLNQSVQTRSWLIIGLGTLAWILVGPLFIFGGLYFLWQGSASPSTASISSANAKFLIFLGTIFSLVYFALLLIYYKEQQTKNHFFTALANNTLNPQKIVLVYRQLDSTLETGPYPPFYAVAIIDPQISKKELLFPLPKDAAQQLYIALCKKFPNADSVSML